ncbi:MAG: excisionase family DNA-binding protein [Chloroflexi bacterium]|nr:excisionase family DNA-binding protein [Chloroflexota bacterium]
MTEDRLLLTPEEAARRLSVGRSHLYLKIASGEIESVRIGRSRRIPRHALDAYVAMLLRESGNASAGERDARDPAA